MIWREDLEKVRKENEEGFEMRTARLLLVSGSIITVNLDHVSAAMPGRFGGTSDMTVIFLGSKSFEVDMKYAAFFDLWIGTPPQPTQNFKDSAECS